MKLENRRSFNPYSYSPEFIIEEPFVPIQMKVLSKQSFGCNNQNVTKEKNMCDN